MSSHPPAFERRGPPPPIFQGVTDKSFLAEVPRPTPLVVLDTACAAGASSGARRFGDKIGRSRGPAQVARAPTRYSWTS
jgi:hypothetical protein